MNTERPLDGLRSIKAKLAVLVGLGIVAASVVSEAGDRAGVPAWLTVPVTIAGGLAVAQWLARGMTSPLREMTAATAVMATGDYSRRVTATSADEVGQLARAFNTMAADLATADQQRRHLVAMVSHELRTPLTAQQALLENLVDGVVSPDDAVLRTALTQAERLSDLVSDLLDLSRVDGGLKGLAIAPVDVAQLLSQAVAEARASGADQRQVTLETIMDGEPAASGAGHLDDAFLRVEADADRLAQVLANLLDNAIRHSPVGGSVRVRAMGLDAERWALEVSDDGPGIPADRAERVFDRFGSWGGSGGGTGLGLAIASWVCELHGGSIAVLPSEPGATGARVRAVLPRHPPPPLPPPPPTAVPRHAP
ncbi:HAMP domain-containing sensor histidine kinase, partial [Intrasporangium sp.]|uniref:HAMP domain-containing sensor histidine kinase n=1 Tax=Intrasporangium sp. TaxID=1925024 RepID=UPI002939E961